jgi:hypothetical protein
MASSACSGKDGAGFRHPMDDGGTTMDGSTSGESGTSDGVAPNDSGHDSSVTDTGAPDTSHPIDTGVDTGTITSADGFGAARTMCIDEINKLRATQSLPPYTLVDDAATDTCVDEQATYDEAHSSPHDAWLNGVYPTCNGNAQDECEGYGTTPSGIKACLDSMWAEQYNSNCLGCVGCTAFGGMCPDCDFYGTMGPECGHYVNMSAVYFSKVWCGFATSPGTWAAQNFQ